MLLTTTASAGLRGRAILVAAAVIVSAGCVVTPRSTLTRDPDFTPDGWTSIAVLPFSGTTAYSRSSAEYLAFGLRKQPYFKIVDPATVELAARRKGLALETAQRQPSDADIASIAALVGAQALVLGTITLPESPPSSRVALAEVRLKAPLVDGAEPRAYLELFAARHTLSDRHVVYYYRSTGTRSVSGGVLLAVGVQGKTVVDRLWILVDKESGLVQDYVFREQQ